MNYLSTRQPLKGNDLAKAKEQMGVLREAGYTNKETSDLTNGAWSESTIKLYTRGVEVKDSTPKQNAVGTLTEIAGLGLSLSDVEFAVS